MSGQVENIPGQAVDKGAPPPANSHHSISTGTYHRWEFPAVPGKWYSIGMDPSGDSFAKWMIVSTDPQAFEQDPPNVDVSQAPRASANLQVQACTPKEMEKPNGGCHANRLGVLEGSTVYIKVYVDGGGWGKYAMKWQERNRV